MVTSVRYIIIVIAMITTGAIAVSKLLVGNCTLQYLNVGCNAIGDDGISVIVEQLQHITTLTKLVVTGCGLSVKGIASSCSVCKMYISPDSTDYLAISLVVSLSSISIHS